VRARDLTAGLRAAGWRFGTRWVGVNSGPDRKLWWARKDGELFAAWSERDLWAQITSWLMSQS
jgi:hypothetical protein